MVVKTHRRSPSDLNLVLGLHYAKAMSANNTGLNALTSSFILFYFILFYFFLVAKLFSELLEFQVGMVEYGSVDERKYINKCGTPLYLRRNIKSTKRSLVNLLHPLPLQSQTSSNSATMHAS